MYIFVIYKNLFCFLDVCFVKNINTLKKNLFGINKIYLNKNRLKKTNTYIYVNNFLINNKVQKLFNLTFNLLKKNIYMYVFKFWLKIFLKKKLNTKKKKFIKYFYFHQKPRSWISLFLKHSFKFILNKWYKYKKYYKYKFKKKIKLKLRKNYKTYKLNRK